jgi:DNA-binding SARP family transcriptional activator
MSTALQLSLLGGFRLSQDGDAIAISPGSQRLLAFLALQSGAGGPITRDRAAGVLWPEVSECRAHANLRAALARLGHLRSRTVRSAGAELALVDGLALDLRGARLVAAGAIRGAKPSSTAAMIALLSWELLPGWYEEWVLNDAEDWRQLRLHGLEALADRLRMEGRFGEAASAAVAAVCADELRESARAALVRVHLAEGNQSEALREFQRYRDLLRSVLDLEPTAHLRALLPARGTAAGHGAVTVS